MYFAIINRNEFFLTVLNGVLMNRVVSLTASERDDMTGGAKRFERKDVEAFPIAGREQYLMRLTRREVEKYFGRRFRVASDNSVVCDND